MDALGISTSARERVLSAWVTMTLAHTHGLIVQRHTLDAHFLIGAFFKPVTRRIRVLNYSLFLCPVIGRIFSLICSQAESGFPYPNK